MAPAQSSDMKFEIGHVLFIDIVGYSKLLITEQSDQIQNFGEGEAADEALLHVLKLRPDVAETAGSEAEKWSDADNGKHFTDGLRKAGLEIARG